MTSARRRAVKCAVIISENKFSSFVSWQLVRELESENTCRSELVSFPGISFSLSFLHTLQWNIWPNPQLSLYFLNSQFVLLSFLLTCTKVAHDPPLHTAELQTTLSCQLQCPISPEITLNLPLTTASTPFCKLYSLNEKKHWLLITGPVWLPDSRSQREASRWTESSKEAGVGAGDEDRERDNFLQNSETGEHSHSFRPHFK